MNKIAYRMLIGACLATGSVCAQQSGQLSWPTPQTVTIPVKGTLSSTNEASVSVVLRLFDREFGGAKLYEERQTVEVVDGVFVAFVGQGTREGVPKNVTDSHPVVYAEWSLASSASIVPEQRVSVMHTRTNTAIAPNAVSVSVPVDMSICFTCGGSWPIFSGMSRNGGITAAERRVTERGAACSGPLLNRPDTLVFHCSR